MTGQQPLALRLADALASGWASQRTALEAAFELLRLAAVEKERDQLRATLETEIATSTELSAAVRGLQAERNQLRDEVEALRADAERYRWLREAWADWGICEWDNSSNEWVRDSRAAPVVDAAIDAARKAGEGEA